MNAPIGKGMRCSVAIGLCVLFKPLTLYADYWHDPTLDTASLEQWMQDVKASVPEMFQQPEQSTLRMARGPEDLLKPGGLSGDGSATVPVPGALLQARLTPQQQALLGRKADQCLQTLAYMSTNNIAQREFPSFRFELIPQYRDAAKQMLMAMGSSGKSAVVERLRSELMGQGIRLPDSRMRNAETYATDLLDVLASLLEQGAVSPADVNSLQLAASGQKAGFQKELAEKLNKLLQEGLSLPALFRWLQLTASPNDKAMISAQIGKRLGNADFRELLLTLQNPDLNSSARNTVSREFSKRLPNAAVAELLRALEIGENRTSTDAVIEELRGRRPSRDDIKGPIADVWQFAQSDNQQVSAYARWYVNLALRDARMLYCIHWLGQGDQGMNELIWEQIDARIARAGSDEIGDYLSAGVKAAQFEEATMASRVAALELLRRLKQQKAVGDLIDLLGTAPRELWPHIGACLRDLTGQNYGPKAGDGLAEVLVAVKNWRAWWDQNGK